MAVTILVGGGLFDKGDMQSVTCNDRLKMPRQNTAHAVKQ
jgi:hypothetical protein